MDVMMRYPAVIEPSAMPKSKRHANKPPKLEQAAWQKMITDQAI